MSPECGWFEIPPYKKDVVIFRLGGKKELQRILNSCEGFFITEELLPIKDSEFSPELLERNLKRAKESDNFYHVIPLSGTKSAKNTRDTWNEKLENITLENAETKTGHPSQYRGKHRSHTRGPQTLFYNENKKLSH